MHSKFIIGCDLDGVIGDIVRQLLEFSHREHGVWLTKKHIISENVETCTPLRRDQLHTLFENREFFRTLPVIPQARELLLRLQVAGCTVHIITDRFWYRGIHKDTTDWLVRHRIPFDSVTFARKAEKCQVAERLQVNCFIEDQLSNALTLAPLCPVLLIDRPYNKGDVPPRVTRVRNLKAAVTHILERPTSLSHDGPVQDVPLRCLA